MAPDTNKHQEQAEHCFELKNYPLAELHIRRAQAAGMPVENFINQLRAAYGMPEGFMLCEPQQVQATAEKYLLIKAWGYGFWSDVHHVICQLFLAELTGRTPILLWGENSLFRQMDEIDSFPNYFQPISSVSVNDIPSDVSIWPPKWRRNTLHAENLNKWEGAYSRLSAQYFFLRNETLLVSDFYTPLCVITPWLSKESRYYGMDEDELYHLLFTKYLRPVNHLSERANEIYQQKLHGRNWIAVHARGSDKVLEAPDLDKINQTYYQIIDRIIELNPQIGVLLVTESDSILGEYQKRYSDRLVYTDVERTSTTTGIHLSGKDGKRLGEEVLVDALLALKCEYFIGNQESNVSLAIASLGHWTKGYIFLLGRAPARGENPFLHQRAEEEGKVCQVCDSGVTFQFSRLNTDGSKTKYYSCPKCAALQTSAADLTESVGKEIDVSSATMAQSVAHLFQLSTLLPHLGVGLGDYCIHYDRANGEFARLMRDSGYNFILHNPLATGPQRIGEWPSLRPSIKLLTIFEESQHSVSRIADLWSTIFAADPEFVVGAVDLYQDGGLQWINSRISPSANHVYYHTRTIAHIASSAQRHAYLFGSYFLISRRPLSRSAVKNLEASITSGKQLISPQLAAWLSQAGQRSRLETQREVVRAQSRQKNIRIAVDGYFFRYSTGISRVWRSLLREWSVNGFAEFIVLIQRDSPAPQLPGYSYVQLGVFDYYNRPNESKQLDAVCKANSITTFISTYYTTPTTVPSVLMVHDMIPEIMGFDLANEQWRAKHEAISYASRYLTVSQSTANDLGRFFPKIQSSQVRVTHCGTDFRPQSDEAVQAFRQRYGIQRPYFLLSGAKTDYKNALLFFKAFAQFGDARENYAIVCTNSKPELEDEFIPFVGKASIHCLVLPDEDLLCAYTGALALAYPSRYEGFGLPVLEAMACGCPVITCANSSIIEVGGDAVVFVDPDNSEQMLKALELVIQDASRQELIARGLARAEQFSWRKMAEQIEDHLLEWSLKLNK